MFGFAVLILVNFLFPVNCVIVETTHGFIRGKVIQLDDHHVIKVYLGIPFAEPPMNQLRFQLPVRAKKWYGVRNALRFRKSCFQLPINNPPVPWSINSSETDEDCLYLNVWQPCKLYDPFPALKPIMIWIYGGSFTSSGASQDVFIPHFLSMFGEVVVVTLNYRLGALGLLYGNIPEAPGNMALWDQYYAIKWIRDNAYAFGGDPDRITLFGESVGGVSVGVHAISPLTRPLVQQFVMQSATPFFGVPLDNEQGPLKLRNISASLNCFSGDENEPLNENVIRCLQSRPAADIIAAERALFPVATVSMNIVTGDAILPEAPASLITKNHMYDDKPVLLGYNKDEGSLFLYLADPDSWFNHSYALNNQKVQQFIQTFFPEAVGTTIYKRYFSNIEGEDDDHKRLVVMTEILGAYVFKCSIHQFAESYPGRSYVYNFNYLANKYYFPWPRWMDVTHFVDVEFVFGRPFEQFEEYTELDRLLSATIITAMASFAHQG